MPLQDKIALVTGASRGIGHAIALALGQQGVTVIGTATSDEGAKKITQALSEQGVKGAGIKCDVCDFSKVKELLDNIKDQFGAPTILVNNAGITRDNIVLRMKEDQWNDVINTNLNAVFHLTKACLKPMVKARWGRIIGITSVVGVMGNPGQANYTAAKAGLIGFTKSLAMEMAPFGITANTVAPGFIDTDMTRALNDEQRAAILSHIPMRKIGVASDIADAVLFLASEKSAYMTGQTLHVNGGMCMV